MKKKQLLSGLLSGGVACMDDYFHRQGLSMTIFGQYCVFLFVCGEKWSKYWLYVKAVMLRDIFFSVFFATMSETRSRQPRK